MVLFDLFRVLDSCLCKRCHVHLLDGTSCFVICGILCILYSRNQMLVSDKCYILINLTEQVKADKGSVRACFQRDDTSPRTPTYDDKEYSNSLVSTPYASNRSLYQSIE